MGNGKLWEKWIVKCRYLWHISNLYY